MTSQRLPRVIGIVLLAGTRLLCPGCGLAQATCTPTATARTVVEGKYGAEFCGSVPGHAAHLLRQRVGPAQCGESGEVPVGGVQDAAVLDRQRRQIGITDQRTSRLAILHHLPQEAPVLISDRQEAHVRLLQPLIHYLDGFLWREPFSGESRVCDDSEEGRYGLPW